MKKDLLLNSALGNKVFKNYLSVETAEEINADDNDDAITLAIKSIALSFRFFLLSFLLSYFLFTIQIIFNCYKLLIDELSFTPMLIGLIYCVGSWSLLLWKFCRGLTAVSPERRLFMRAQGLDIRDGYMTYDSFPLMRQLFFWIIVLIIFGTLTLISYILFYLWFTVGIIGMWHALAPTLFVLSLIMSYLYVVNTIHIKSFFKIFIVLLTIILSVFKKRAEMTNKLDQIFISWYALLLPLVCVQVVTVLDITKICFNYWVTNTLQMNKTQQHCCILYIISILLMIVVEIIPINNANFIAIVRLLSCVLFTISLMSVIDKEFVIIRKTRGYNDPIPLSKTKNGWEASKVIVDHKHILLGTIKI